MSNSSNEIQQERIGYLIVLGRETPVLIERLRTIPFADWQRSDFMAEMAAQENWCERHFAQLAKKSHELGWLIAMTRPLALQHPDASPNELIEMLPEPERSKARAIVNAVGDSPANVSIPLMMPPQTNRPQ